jgi:hypothetical protein
VIARSIKTGFLFLSLLGVPFFLGCAHSKSSDVFGGYGDRSAALPPGFLLSPSSLLLTNAAGYSARVKSDEYLGQYTNHLSGQLFCSGTKLLFVPDPGKRRGKNSPGQFSFLWDTSTRQGHVLSEALQGLAPFGISTTVTNLQIENRNAPSEVLDNHICQVEQAFVSMNDGSRADFAVWLASDLKRFPIRINTISNASPFSVTLSKVKLGPQQPELFAVPSDFTRYSSAEAMMSEIVIRQHNLKRSSSGSPEPIYPSRERR